MKVIYAFATLFMGFSVIGCGQDPNSPLVAAQAVFDRTAEGYAGFEWDSMSKEMREKLSSI